MQIMRNRRQIESGEMEQLQPRRISQYGAQIGCCKIAMRPETNQMLVAAPVRNLQQTQSVARGNQPHCFGIDGDRTIGEDACWHVFFM